VTALFWRGLLALSLFASTALAQTTSPVSSKNKKAVELYTEADNYRVRGQYAEAISLLDKALERDKNFFEAYFRLGLIYKAQKDWNKSTDRFLSGLELSADARWRKAFSYELGDNYMQVGDYVNAKKFLDAYLLGEALTKPKVVYAKMLRDNAVYGLANQDQSLNLTARPIPDSVNAFQLQYFPVLTADESQIVFTRRKSAAADADEDLVVATRKSDGSWSMPRSISDNINSTANEGTCTISADGRTLIFTSCGGRRGFGNCDLFQSQKTGQQWSVPINMGAAINSAAWESQPSLSADGRVLYFVSDRKGGIGGRDLYVSYRMDDGKWTKGENLGKAINTPYDEISPFIHASNRVLFFSSNGRPGFGGYDIYRTDRTESGWNEPVNAGYPINNHQDQFSMFVTPDGKRAYYAHEEEDQRNTSYLYQVEVPEALRIAFRSNVVKGVVRDRQTKQPVKARIELVDLKKNELQSWVYSDSLTGAYLIVLNQGSDYALFSNASEYLFNSVNFNYESAWQTEPVLLDIYLDRIGKGKSVVLQNIFFDFNSYELAEKSKSELEKMRAFLQQNPAVRVEIGGHTDNIGTESYNQTLSKNRALSVANFLIQAGIDKTRVIPKGYGSQKPLKSNDTEENRQQNRRIEFQIVQQ
jgi:outer membrane protein OmpA-like peptidoglycan-associated protein